MVFSELPVGARFFFGRQRKTRYEYVVRETAWYEDPIEWIKTNDRSISITVNEMMHSKQFDRSRPLTGANESIRVHGNRFFFDSTIFRYLNSLDSSWINIEGELESKDSEGFLSHFNETERSMLEKFDLQVSVPRGYTRKYGQSVSREVLVGLPSLAQLGAESPYNGTFGVDRAFYTWTVDADDHNALWCAGKKTRAVKPNIPREFHPIIRIKDDAPVDVDQNGHFIIRLAEKDFDGDLCMFLGFEAQEAA